MQSFNLPIARSFDSTFKVRDVLVVNDETIIFTFSDSQQLVAVNYDLDVLWTRDVDMQVKEYVYPVLTVRRDELLYSIADIDSVRLLTIDGNLLFTYPHDAWYSFLGSGCYFYGEHVLFVVPAAKGDQLVVVNTVTFEVVKVYQLDGDQEYNYSFHATPSADTVFLELAAGQDDTRMFSIRLLPELEIVELADCNDEIFGAFSPSGNEFVTAPHYDDGIKVFSFPDVELVAEISQEDLFAGRDEYPAENADSLNYRAMYVSDALLLAVTRFGRLLLIARDTMQCMGELLLEGCEIVPYKSDTGVIEDYEGTVGDVKLLPGGRLLVGHSDGSVRVYDINCVK